MTAAKKITKASKASHRLDAETGRYAASGSSVRIEVVRLSDPVMKKDMGELKRRIAVDPGFGRKLLRQAGIVTAKGNLTKRFGG